MFIKLNTYDKYLLEQIKKGRFEIERNTMSGNLENRKKFSQSIEKLIKSDRIERKVNEYGVHIFYIEKASRLSGNNNKIK